MKLFKKEGDTLQVLCFSDEKVEEGDYLLINEENEERGLLSQVIDVQFVNLPGIMEDLLRDSITEEEVFGDTLDPLNLDSQIMILRDARLLICKIRCTVEDGKLSPAASWLPSRTRSRIRRLENETLVKMLAIGEKRPIAIGMTRDGSEIRIDADSLDGRLAIILGKKGTGKSNLSKVLLLGLIEQKAPCLVLDMNGEYTRLGYGKDGKPNNYASRVSVLGTSSNFRVTLPFAGLGCILNIMTHALGLPGTSTRELIHIWRFLEQRRNLTLKEFGATIQEWDCNESVREAIQARFNTLVNSRLFTDNEAEQIVFLRAVESAKKGGAIIINLKELSSIERRIAVELVLGKLIELLKKLELKAMFLFAEEAHLYLRETYWEDIVTRMRHLGLFTTFVTNQPSSIQESIYRQADSIFLFNFTNDHDLEAISRVAKIDVDTMKLITPTLEPYYCLTIGQATHEMPLVFRVRELDVQTLGETRRFFD